MQPSINKIFGLKIISFSLFLFYATALYGAVKNCTSDCPTCPKSPYQDTCTDCIYLKSTLVAWCEKGKSSRLDTSQSWKPYINKGGVLAGAEKPTDRNYYTFNHSCHSITYDGNMLRGTCRKRDETEVPASLDLSKCDPTGYIDNQNGQLVCVAKQ